MIFANEIYIIEYTALFPRCSLVNPSLSLIVWSSGVQIDHYFFFLEILMYSALTWCVLQILLSCGIILGRWRRPLPRSHYFPTYLPDFWKPFFSILDVFLPCLLPRDWSTPCMGIYEGMKASPRFLSSFIHKSRRTNTLSPRHHRIGFRNPLRSFFYVRFSFHARAILHCADKSGPVDRTNPR